MKKSAERLRVEALRASRINQTLNSQGWGDIMSIIQNKYDDCMNSLLQKESPESRGAINAITEIMNDISTELEFGENARQKYNKLYLNIQHPKAE